MNARKALKTVVIALCTVVVLLLMAEGASLAYAAIDKEDRFYLADAEPVDPNHLRLPELSPNERAMGHQRFGFQIHRLQSGKGAVFGYRFYSTGSVSAIDDETYRKLTVWLPNGLPKTAAEWSLADPGGALVVFSDGGSAWPDNDCSGYVSSGSLRVASNGTRYSVSVHGQTIPVGKWAGERCAPQWVDIEFEASRLNFEQLTPWLGIAGTHPYSETYR